VPHGKTSLQVSNEMRQPVAQSPVGGGLVKGSHESMAMHAQPSHVAPAAPLAVRHDWGEAQAVGWPHVPHAGPSGVSSQLWMLVPPAQAQLR
jgi:hypothetical protein